MSSEPAMIGLLAMGLTGHEEIQAAHSVHYDGGPLNGTTEVRSGRDPQTSIETGSGRYELATDGHGPVMTAEGRWLYRYGEQL